jgi:hypothetical protein
MVVTRLGPFGQQEGEAWEGVLKAYISAGSSPSAFLGPGVSCLESIALVALTSEAPIPLHSAWDTPTGPFLLQQQEAKGGSGAGATHVVWMPPSSPASMILPGEADRLRVLHLEFRQHYSLHDALRSAAA